MNDQEKQKILKEVLDVQHTAMIFNTTKAAEQNIIIDYNNITKGGAIVTFHKQLMSLQMGLNPIKLLHYFGKEVCLDKLSSRKWHKILFLDFEASSIIKEFSRSRLALKGKTLFGTTDDYLKNGLI